MLRGHDVRVDAEQLAGLGRVAGLLGDLADDSVGRVLARVDPATGQGPAGAAAFVPVREQDAAFVDDHAVCGHPDIHPDRLLADVGGTMQTGWVPELPEVTALAADLDSRLRGRTIDRLSIVAFAALKTFDPPASALSGTTISGVTRHGKFLDIAAEGSSAEQLHLVIHLARAGWIRWRDGAPPPPSGPAGPGPLAARLVLDDGTGFDMTEAGTKKSLAISVVREPNDVPGIAAPRPRSARSGFHPRGVRGHPARRRTRPDQRGAAQPVDHRGNRQRVLR